MDATHARAGFKNSGIFPTNLSALSKWFKDDLKSRARLPLETLSNEPEISSQSEVVALSSSLSEEDSSISQNLSLGEVCDAVGVLSPADRELSEDQLVKWVDGKVLRVNPRASYNAILDQASIEPNPENVRVMLDAVRAYCERRELEVWLTPPYRVILC